MLNNHRSLPKKRIRSTRADSFFSVCYTSTLSKCKGKKYIVMTDIFEADVNNGDHADAILVMLNEYAMDIMGGSKGISAFVQQNLISQLKSRPEALVLLALNQLQPVGLAIAFEGFSTFQAKPLLNLHDFAVSSHARGKGIAKAMLEKLENIARHRGYCKITLEVLEGNLRAQKIYKDFGFHSYNLDAAMGRALFLHKELVEFSS